jgi:6-phosphogluconolactonase
LSDNVYVQSNEADGNRVLAFRRDGDGTLTQIRSFTTSGAGSGTPHLQSQASVVLAGGGSHLLVANAGSGQLSAWLLLTNVRLCSSGSCLTIGFR